MAKGNKIMKRIVALVSVVTILCIIIMYVLKQNQLNRRELPLELSAWIVDWQWRSGLDDLGSIAENLASLQLFAAYFDDSDDLYFTEGMKEALPEVLEGIQSNERSHIYLTVVNDIWGKDGTAVQKDTKLITRLVATEESRNKHINDLLDIVDKYNLGGLELDYEKIDDKDWNVVLNLYTDLYQRLDEKGKSLRVILEPRTPIERLSLPEGPEYVMMAYNLYGTHSGTGPKADDAFIRELAGRMNQVPGNNVIAFATGGFDWVEEGMTTSVTEKRAENLAQESMVLPKRDAESGSLYFGYQDVTGAQHTVWYADDVTLSQWIHVSQEAGYNKVALWRLGDLGEGTLLYLNEPHK